MIALDIAQNSPEWMKARTGIPTASGFDKVVTTKGEASKQRIKYMYQIAAERITGVKEETYQNGAMKRGIEMEAEAREMYSLVSDAEVKEIGFCYADDRKLYGCSPDGLVGDDGILEIKCPTSAVHVGYLLDGKLPNTYYKQIMGQLLVTGRKWCDFVSYYPGLKPLIVRVEPDTKFLEALRGELETFCKELDAVEQKIRGK